jgi:hypothetical protein
MTRRYPIILDLPARIDRVTFALAPTDGVTGAVVRSGVSASVKGLPNRPIRNSSGLLVFVNLPDRPSYEIELDAREAGYFGPDSFVWEPPSGEPSPRQRQVDRLLQPRPDFPFRDSTTLVRGVVVRGGAAVADARIWARPAPDSGPFETRSTERGAFALALRLPPLEPFEDELPVDVEIHVEQGPDGRRLTRRLTNGRSHSFEAPIDLTGTNQPAFFQGG